MANGSTSIPILPFDYLAMGQYAILKAGDSPLIAGRDESVDQSYFLAGVHRDSLDRVIFPVGGMSKKQVRLTAKYAGFPSSIYEKPSSTGLCFVGNGRFRKWISDYVESSPGEFVEWNTGAAIGQHEGLAFYTIGQAARLGGRTHRLYVIDKDPQTNKIFLGMWNHSKLWAWALSCTGPINWISRYHEKLLAERGELNLWSRCRYQEPLRECKVTSSTESGLRVQFFTPVRAVTPGQIIVLYDKSICCGSAQILPGSIINDAEFTDSD